MTLRAHSIGVRFRGVVALDGVDIAVEPGQVVALVGPNGSGKSTLFNAITGFVALHSGSVFVDEEDISDDPADARIRRGVARTFQTPRIDADLTVADSVLCGFLPSLRTALVPAAVGIGGTKERDARASCERLLDSFGLADHADTPLGELPLGTVRMADVLRAMAMNPRYLLLDEPAAGLSQEEQQLLTSGIRTIADSGVGVLLVEQNFPLVRDIADVLVVLESGKVIASGEPEHVASDARVVEAYLGSSGESGFTKHTPASAGGAPALTVNGFSVSYGRARVCHDVDLTVGRGEITAVLGPNGAGKSSLMAALAGIRLDGRRWSGTVALGDHDISELGAQHRAGVGLAFVPERRGNTFPGLSVEENLTLALQVLPRADSAEALSEVHEIFPKLTTLAGTQVGLLSGGEQQMVAIGMALCTRPSALLLDEPTQGLAPAILDDLIETFAALRDKGLAVLLAEQNQSFAAALADNFLVLSHGEVAARGGHAELADRRAIADAYL
ncbi:ATP-binding cassette domain-containing protein [Gordonia hydrophobica]|uniref:ATP-binding cassette domain-containing protein n=1 Tax=Gordonia hydrophobica TaxID=40516 RepID=A0ABZ2U5F1_9ACTN|nr:ATP-binding cassette domain-containing protein [Gordonia hydrophobica]MBM7368647.1 ABC-type branched-subunit amino acid transport system ATPase component [Gordonia hydrophobica]